MSAASRLLSPLLERSGNYNLSSPSISVSSSASSASMTAESPPPLTFPINPGLFFDAVYNNDIATLRRLHQADPELSKARAGSGMTPLLFAVDQNCADVVRFLLEEAKVDVNDCDAKGVNSLIIAVENGNEFLVNYLLQMGANPNKRDCDEASPLLIAAELRRTKIVRLLVRARADCNTADNLGQTPLLASVYTRNLKAVRVLLEEGNADVDQAMKGGYSPLHLACKMGHLPIVSYLLQEHRKANVNLSDDDGLGPLHVAVINNQREIVQFLLGYSDANVDLRDERGFTPIHHAAVKGNLEMVKLLVVEGHADVDICSYEGVSVLDCASIRGSQEVYDYLAPLMTSPPHEADASGPAMVEFLQFLHMCAESEQQHNVHSYSVEANEPAPAAGEGGGLAVTVPADSPAEEEDDVVPLPGAGFGAGPRSPSNLAAPRRSIDENDDGHSITVTRSNLGSIQDVSRSRSDRKLLYPKPRFQKKT